MTVFAVDDRSIQISARNLARSTADVTIRGAGFERQLTAPVSAGAAVFTVDGLTPDTHFELTVDHHPAVTARTVHDLGPVLGRAATISDVHLGLDDFGILHRITDPAGPHERPSTYRCAAAAIGEALDWGAELLIVKGDLTNEGQRDEWDLAAALLENVPVPVLFAPGNHDWLRKRDLDPTRAPVPSNASGGVLATELAGVRIITADTSVPGWGFGRLRPRVDDIIEHCDPDVPTFLAIHHNLQRTPVLWFWPPGIASPEVGSCLTALAAHTPSLFVTSGHTHRNRSHRLGPGRRVTFTEVAATSDHPGVWGAYTFHANGIRQCARRIEDPDALVWLERTARGVGGLWPRWSQGRLGDRCIDHRFD